VFLLLLQRWKKGASDCKLQEIFLSLNLHKTR
jgi:hypothetical protein